MTSERQKFRFPVWETLYVCGVLIILGFILLYFCWIGDYGVGRVLKILSEQSFIFHQNIVFYVNFNGHELPSYLYLAICCASMVLLIFGWIKDRWFPDVYETPTPSDNLRYITTILICLMSFMQLISIYHYWVLAAKNFVRENKYEETNVAHPKDIADAYLTATKGLKLRAQFVTDMDTSEDPGMIEHRSLAFFLYPIDIRNIYQKDFDAWIAYEKDNAQDFVPAGYRVLHQYDDRNLLAVKEQ